MRTRVDDDASPRPDGLSGCATAIYDAAQAPTAMMVVLDRSSSMSQNNKYAFAAQAIVSALDQDAFDPIELGLYAAPSSSVTGPECIFNFPVACGVPAFPQVELAPAGLQKSNAASGVRRAIKDWLNTHPPDTGAGDASPMYDATSGAIAALQAWPGVGHRILMIVTDGSLSCGQFSNRAGFSDCNGCDHDWEDPNNLVGLLGTAHADATKPITSFVVGVPGADTYDAQGCNYPPYRMRAALSAIAAAGAPDLVPATCDGLTFTQASENPTESCHFDMTTPGSFSATALAEAIAFARGATLGCVFDLPEPDGGGVVDLDRVNVEYTADAMETSLARRGNPADPCTTVGCWDYTPENKVELLGVACDAVTTAPDAQVRIITGCDTVVLE